MKLSKNQTKIFLAVISEWEDEVILGADLSLEKAWKRLENHRDYEGHRLCVYEMPLESPHNFIRYDDKHGYKVHSKS